MQKAQKSKVTYLNASISVLFLNNLVRATKANTTFQKKESKEEKPEIYNAELSVDGMQFFGEMTIASFILQQVNLDRPTAEKYFC
jgi:hypothetical protein